MEEKTNRLPGSLKMNLGSINLNTEVARDGNESFVLVLYTGGTIGMVRNAEGALAPAIGAMEAKIRQTCTMHDQEYSQDRFGHLASEAAKNPPLVLPVVPEHKRVIYTIYEYDPLLDSSNMTMDDWVLIAKDVQDNYEVFDGFVILHGTDTMAFTASALSFMLEHLGKPVIVTGSQIPCFETRSDGRDNFVGALILAGNYQIPEACVYFNHQLMRGNRTIKVSAGNLDAFHSPNMTPLVKVGIDIEVDYRSIHRSTEIKRFTVQSKLNPNVVLLRLFPSIKAETMVHFFKAPIEGVVLQCYGAGNFPNNRLDLMAILKEATDRGVLVLSVTQCITGTVSGIYATGKALLDIGIIPGNDMTPEAALTKLAYVLAKEDLSLDEKKGLLEANLSGEMTVLQFKGTSSRRTSLAQDQEDDLILAVAKQLKVKTSDEMEGIRQVLFPSILCAAVHTGQTAKLEYLKNTFEADFTTADYDARTPLHVAASEGNVAVVEYLLKSGASVHARDRNNDTPLLCAIKSCQRDVVRSLIACGAHLQLSSLELGEELGSLARLGSKKRISCYKLAGASLNACNLSRQTPLHCAVETGQLKVVQFLLEHGVEMTKKDVFGRTPLDIAKVLNKVEITNLLQKYMV